MWNLYGARIGESMSAQLVQILTTILLILASDEKPPTKYTQSESTGQV